MRLNGRIIIMIKILPSLTRFTTMAHVILLGTEIIGLTNMITLFLNVMIKTFSNVT